MKNCRFRKISGALTPEKYTKERGPSSTHASFCVRFSRIFTHHSFLFFLEAIKKKANSILSTWKTKKIKLLFFNMSYHDPLFAFHVSKPQLTCDFCLKKIYVEYATSEIVVGNENLQLKFCEKCATVLIEVERTWEQDDFDLLGTVILKNKNKGKNE
jgi:hypothetical protein